MSSPATQKGTPVLDLLGVATTYRFRLDGLPQVAGQRGMRATVAGTTVKVVVNVRGEATSVTVHGRKACGSHGVAIFYRQDLDADPVARRAADAAEREWALLLRPIHSGTARI
jgi:hypothetical protein